MADHARTALLLMDLQEGIADAVEAPGLAARANAAAAAARAAGVRVAWVKVGLRPGAPEVSGANRMFAAIREADRMVAGRDSRLLAELEVADGEPVVDKKRISAFAGSDLALLLSAWQTRALVLGGVSTSGVVLSTLRYAADLDYELTVLSDLCVDRDEEVHRVLCEKVFPRQAEVTTVEEWAGRVAA